MTYEKLHYIRFLADHSRRDIYARRDGKTYVPVREKLTPVVLERHLNSSPAIGQYIVSGS